MLSQYDEVIAVGMNIIDRTVNFLVEAFGKLPEIELDGFFLHQVNLIENKSHMFMEKYLSTETSAISTMQKFKIQPLNSKIYINRNISLDNFIIFL